MEAQKAAGAVLPALRKPSPPMRSGSDAVCLATSLKPSSASSLSKLSSGGWRHAAQVVVASRARAKQQQQPRRLKLRQRAQGCQQPPMLLADLGQLGRHEVAVPEGNSKHHETTSLRGQRVISHPDRRLGRAHVLKAQGLLTSSIPHASLAQVDANSALVSQLFAEHVEDGPGTLRATSCVHIIQERVQVLARAQSRLHSSQSWVLAESI